jgi:hypothetical protein
MKTLADIVAAEHLVAPARLAVAARHATATGEPLLVVLIESEHIAEAALTAALARHVGQAPIAIGDIDDDALREVPHDLARSRRLVPIAVTTPRDGPRLLTVAMADPTDRETILEVETASGCRVEPLLAPLTAIEDAVRRAYRGVVTMVMRPEERRLPFGGDLAVTRPAFVTQPHHRLDDDAPLELRHRALLELLVAKGLISLDEYQRELRRLLGASE